MICKVAIHQRIGSFSDRWVNYCCENNVNYIIVDCHSSDIIKILIKNKITHLLWHVNHGNYTDLRTFSYVLNAADNIGIKTFPNYHTRWHFDDKIAQKYLLESKEVPLVPSYVYYEKDKAINFVKSNSFPFVFKLRRGAGAVNVKLINSINEGLKYVDLMFSEGISTVENKTSRIKKYFKLVKTIKKPFLLLKKIKNRIKITNEQARIVPPEKGYFYTQDFLKKNDFDTRVIVIGNKAFAIKRFNRKNDFRASGSGVISYDNNEIDLNMLKIAFETSKKLKFQCIAYDFAYNNKQPQIIEVCFGFSMLAYDKCPGYWNNKIEFIKTKFNPQYWMIEQLLKASKNE
ncbi:MAG: ATP-grasp domain-containing protein [Polaribacter sp.]